MATSLLRDLRPRQAGGALRPGSPAPPGAARAGRGCGLSLEVIGHEPGGRGRPQLSEPPGPRVSLNSSSSAARAGARAQKPTGRAGMVQRRLRGARTH